MTIIPITHSGMKNKGTRKVRRQPGHHECDSPAVIDFASMAWQQFVHSTEVMWRVLVTEVARGAVRGGY